jgi:hypothetical protein
MEPTPTTTNGYIISDIVALHSLSSRGLGLGNQEVASLRGQEARMMWGRSRLNGAPRSI